MGSVYSVRAAIGYPNFLTVAYTSTAIASGAGRARSGWLQSALSTLHSLHSGQPPNNKKKAFSKLAERPFVQAQLASKSFFMPPETLFWIIELYSKVKDDSSLL